LLDLSPTLLFEPLRQTGSTPMELVFAGCTAPAGPSTSCTPNGGARYSATSTSQTTGTCLDAIAGTTHGYSPAITATPGPCFASDPRELAVQLNGVSITLKSAQVAATWNGTPATGLTSRLLRGFISEADADATIIPLPFLGDTPLSKLLPGGTGNCAGYSDKDVGPGGVTGWYFYLNFTAVNNPWSE